MYNAEIFICGSRFSSLILIVENSIFELGCLETMEEGNGSRYTNSDNQRDDINILDRNMVLSIINNVEARVIAGVIHPPPERSTEDEDEQCLVSNITVSDLRMSENVDIREFRIS